MFSHIKITNSNPNILIKTDQCSNNLIFKEFSFLNLTNVIFPSSTDIIYNENCIFPKGISCLNLAYYIFAKKTFKSSNIQELWFFFLLLFLCLMKHASLKNYKSKIPTSPLLLILILNFFYTFGYKYKKNPAMKPNTHFFTIYLKL